MFEFKRTASSLELRRVCTKRELPRPIGSIVRGGYAPNSANADNTGEDVIYGIAVERGRGNEMERHVLAS